MNKSNITNIISMLLMILAYLNHNHTLFTIGIFAFSGSVTNTIAIYMLFEKVPFLYGSGIVENKFEQIKLSIHNLLMKQFFTKENLQKFFENEVQGLEKIIDFKKVLNQTNFSLAYESLKEAVLESPFGSMLEMFGGEQALEGLKKPFIKKLQSSMIKISQTQSFQNLFNETLKSNQLNDDIYDKLSAIVDTRLNELTPKMVKDIIQEMIKEHLGWLVIWGAIFGGLIGFVSTLIV